jgi:chromosome segregation ATPase
MNDIERLNDHMAHVLGRINHMEAQIESLAKQLTLIQAQIALIQQRARVFKDGSQLIDAPGGITIVDGAEPYNRNPNG